MILRMKKNFKKLNVLCRKHPHINKAKELQYPIKHTAGEKLQTFVGRKLGKQTPKITSLAHDIYNDYRSP